MPAGGRRFLHAAAPHFRRFPDRTHPLFRAPRQPNTWQFCPFARRFRDFVAIRLSVADRVNKVATSTTQQPEPKPKEMNKNTQYRQPSNKDNIATAAVLTATLISIVGTLFASNEARAEPQAVYRMEPIVVTAQREKVVMLDAIIVTASRDARILVALK